MSSTEIVAINRIHRDPNRNDKIPKLGSSHPASASTFPSPEHSKELMLSKAFQKILKMYQLIWRTCIIASLLFGWGRTFHQNIQSKKNTNIIPIVLTKKSKYPSFYLYLLTCVLGKLLGGMMGAHFLGFLKFSSSPDGQMRRSQLLDCQSLAFIKLPQATCAVVVHEH